VSADLPNDDDLYWGWRKPRGGKWSHVASGPSHSVCWDRLLDFKDACEGKHYELDVTHKNDHPNNPMRRRT
jgi:hypothetical protein